MKIQKACKVCGRTMLLIPAKSDTIYCTRACMGKDRRRWIRWMCCRCGKVSRLTKPSNRRQFCLRCSHQHRKEVKAAKNLHWQTQMSQDDHVLRLANLKKKLCKPMWLRAPNGVLHYVPDLTEFIKKNSVLFDPKDVEWKWVQYGSYNRRQDCTARRGLAPLKRSRLSWKGWILATDRGVIPSIDPLVLEQLPSELQRLETHRE